MKSTKPPPILQCTFHDSMIMNLCLNWDIIFHYPIHYAEGAFPFVMSVIFILIQ